MNPLMPSGRTRPLAVYIALRDNRPFGNSARVRGVAPNTPSTNPGGFPNGAGVSTAKLGGMYTLQDLAHV